MTGEARSRPRIYVAALGPVQMIASRLRYASALNRALVEAYGRAPGEHRGAVLGAHVRIPNKAAVHVPCPVPLSSTAQSWRRGAMDHGYAYPAELHGQVCVSVRGDCRVPASMA